MKTRKVKKEFKKYVCCFLAANILFQVCAPTAAFALTSGPSQPEMESFEPVSTTQMVDPFSGDFVYNIPLLTVPGPNGGYPINIAYHAGIGMEQEASWVGLGWNINPGVINRQMRGIPDDFNGTESILKTVSHKPNWTAALGFTFTKQKYKEICGYDLESHNPLNYGDFEQNIVPQSFQLYLNNYKGVGFSYGLSHSFDASIGRWNFRAPLSYSFDSQQGIGVQGSVKFDYMVSKKKNDYEFGIGLNASYNTRQGLNGLGFSTGWSTNKKNHPVANKTFKNTVYAFSGVGVSFSSSTFMPPLSSSLGGITGKLRFEYKTITQGPLEGIGEFILPGGVTFSAATQQFTTFVGKDFDLSFSEQFIKHRDLDYPAYGYLHSGLAKQENKERRILDYNRENDVPLAKDIPALPMPVSTHDVFAVKGQGTGGYFRAFRSDMGIFSEPHMTNDFENVDLALEMGLPASVNESTHWGGDVGGSYSQSYSGPWKNLQNDLNAYDFKNEYVQKDKESVTFKMAGEQTATRFDDDGDLQRFSGNAAVKLKIKMLPDDISLKAKVYSDGLYSNERIKETKATSIQYKTRDEIRLNNNYLKRAEHIWNGGASSWSTDIDEQDPLNYSQTDNFSAYDYSVTGGKLGNHIAEMSVVNPDGNRYTYGIPAYNTLHREYYFATTYSSANTNYGNSWIPAYTTTKTTRYDVGDLGVGNDEGYDKYFSKTEIPAYAHSYLLTTITSPDYVDLTGNGPSEDDFGYYVKFNYYPNESDYQWRAPYMNAFLHKNGLPDKYDDKASFSYGKREQWYLHSVETKTHVAIFELENRQDGFEAGGENNEYQKFNINSTAVKTQKLLNKIRLYSKKNPNTPIKTVSFVYDYSLCKGVLNQSTLNGKLTLKQIKFSYLNNNKGELSPYVFSYNESDPSQNPDYGLSQMDRWGNYKPDAGVGGSGVNDENPYVDQNPANRTNVDKYAAAWSLKQITLPSGAKINVDYEADDYAYVQDKIATQMFKILGTGRTDGTDVSTSGNVPITNGFRRIFFELEDGDVNIPNYLQSLDKVFFKAYVDLKVMPDFSARARDYIHGYATTTGSGTTTVNVNNVQTVVGYVDLDDVTAGKLLGIDVNPIRKASWEYLQNDKPNYVSQEINSNGWSLGWSLVNSIINIFTNSITRIMGFYKHCYTMGYAKSIVVDDANYPSFIRLNSPDKCKVGGGHRVKKITINDSWSDITNAEEDSFDYGQEFSYKLPDGSSSGVAEYEPIVGGEENPLKLPSEQYSENKFILANKQLYHQLPYGESYYPDANVGYSRVTVRSLTRDGSLPEGETANKTRSGFIVQEFFTAKDFPVLVEPTGVTTTKYRPKIMIPFVGKMDFDNYGFSQGYKIVLNDMHGKVKEVSTYGAYSNPDIATSSPTSRVSYNYNTINPYNPHGTNKLSPFVKVLDSDANERLAALGQTYDFFSELNEHSSFKVSAGAGLNLEYQPTAAFLPTFWYNMDYLEANTRMAVTNKIIYQTGIITKVQTTKDGGTSTAENLLYDAKTGQPLLTTVTNNFDKPVYTYSFASHWDYPGMGDAGARYGITVTPSSGTPVAGAVSFSVTPVSLGFEVGDMVSVFNVSGNPYKYQNFWVSAISGNTMTLIDEFGALITSNVTLIKIEKPVQRNLQQVASGSIVSLSNPASDRFNNMIYLFNDKLANSNFASQTQFTHSALVSCGETGEVGILCSLNVINGIPVIDVSKIPPGQGITCSGLSITLSNNTINDFGDIENGFGVTALVKRGNVVYFNNAAGVTQFTGTWSDPDNCFPDCLDGVLHASAFTYSDEWSYNYTDVGNPRTPTAAGTYTTVASVTNNNPYRYGTDGIWRNKYGFAYQVDRKQSTPTDISKDGTYNNFFLYNWQVTDPIDANRNWTFVNEVTRYSPYGFELENQDALNIYKSALYGYENSLVTAIGDNASYHELGYDGFEDYKNNSYTGGHGHLNLTSSGTGVTLSTANAHSGNVSILLAANETVKHTATSFLDNTSGPSNNMRSNSLQHFTVINTVPNSKYVVSAWFKKNSNAGVATISATIDGVALPTSAYEIQRSPVIDGWQKVDYIFSLTSAPPTVSLEISLGLGNSTGYVDDIRIQPFKSAMVTYVYDPVTLWLVAELDNRNFATFYNYDEEGTLVQVKKETEKGISTIKTSRSNITHP